MLLRLAALAAVPVLAAVGITTASPAHASGTYGTCELLAPATARVVDSYRHVPIRMTGGCVLHSRPHAIWYVGQNYSHAQDGVVLDGSGPNVWVLGRNTPLGARTWKGQLAVDAEGHDYQQNSPTTTVKVGSWAVLQATRSGRTVTVDTRAVRYATSLNRNIAWAGQRGTIQYRASASSTWTDLQSFTTNAGGAFRASFDDAGARQYRAVYDEDSYIWGATSPTASVTAAPATHILALSGDDTFTTGQKGVLCQAGPAGVTCGFNTALPYGVTSAQAKKLCGQTALQSISLTSQTWEWGCGTGVPVVPSKATNAWASSHNLPIDKALKAAVVPNNWTFTVDGVPCHVSYNGAVGCSTPQAAATGFVADSHYVYPRGNSNN